MRREDFTTSSPGTLTAVSFPAPDWAFIPDNLPPGWEFPARLWPLLSEAKAEVARLDGAGRHVATPELLLRPLQKREALRSSSLEGTFATPQQLLFYELAPTEPKDARDPASSWQEVFNYSSALQLGQDLLHDLPFSRRLFRRLHHELLRGVRGRSKAPGDFRRTQVVIGSDRRFVPPPVPQMQLALDGLEKHINSDDVYDPLVTCFLCHYQFEAIHPFLDGNGRVGRLLLSLMIFERCGLSRPWLYLSEYFERHKDQYIDSLYRVSSEGAWEPWVEFCLHATIAQAKGAMSRLATLIALKQRYTGMLGTTTGSLRLTRLLDHLFELPVIRPASWAKMTQVTYPTAKKDIERLVAVGVLHEVPNRYPKSYIASEIVQVAYED